jgi:hypothetical protein
MVLNLFVSISYVSHMTNALLLFPPSLHKLQLSLTVASVTDKNCSWKAVKDNW